MSMLINNCKKLTSFSAHLLRSSTAASQILTRHGSYESQRYPGYHVVYVLEPVRTISIINRMKRTSSIMAGIIISGAYGSVMVELLKLEVANSFALAGLSFAMFLHAVGYYCNNTVGYVYTKKDTKDLVISYVSFWGNRVDVQTKADNVDCCEGSNRYYTPMFHMMKVPSSQLSLKLYVDGKITDVNEFYNLFGIELK